MEMVSLAAKNVKFISKSGDQYLDVPGSLAAGSFFFYVSFTRGVFS